MGIFNIFKSKDKVKSENLAEKTVKINDSMVNFQCYYLFGLTDNPNRESKDTKSFTNLYENIIGEKGGIIIGNSFHPYQIVNPKGTTIWHASYVKLYVNENKDEVFKAIINENTKFLVDLGSTFNEINVWPDTRLTYEENPIFSKYVPFIIPFLVYKSEEQTKWDLELNIEIALNGHATNYVNSINELTRFIMPEPSFILGFDEFDEQNPSKLIENFINCKSMFE
ncbi:hypothetical protein O8E88_002362 [Flavobacterium psychrophilum]|uniref:hypothetical protein n=2 Tax=Flavobacterium psychrophilum TaxID=96345 RepID=UPI0004F7C167|nr:hypothetical protein [Flavobacterium psychrophilum]AIN75151.1 hypothetical protein FPG3_06900 [Flavobacterium psychrophilum FPG3]EKT2070533.1 hypothetical protein [Flavobacterium psychrophilum]EKT2072909.1 hypothetical protein [Flavobacterium psychrophilum]EKT4492327.1 hypothetical protein [Flavobacterium psychrophilum]OXB09915.1 hypothetical protein B0A57_09460 [Flavobacterium psychrophilum DSM 3660 = ATCC 49418]